MVYLELLFTCERLLDRAGGPGEYWIFTTGAGEASGGFLAGFDSRGFDGGGVDMV